MIVHALIVDDSASARVIFSTMLESHGIEVDTIADSELGLQHLSRLDESSKRYDVLFIDWKMPKMDGVELLQRMLASQEGKPRPAIIMATAHGREDLESALDECGMEVDWVLSKPVTPSTLLDTVSTVLGRGLVREVEGRSRHADYDDAVADLNGAEILLVEDNEFNQEIACDLLAGKGISLDVAINGQDALDKLTEKTYDGVLMDCQMPVMDGYEATRRIRDMAALKDLPVIAMTANVMARDIAKALDAGMNDHIGKPLNIKEMFVTMAKWIKPSSPAQAPLQPAAHKDGEFNDFAHFIAIDYKVGLQRLEGDAAVYRRLLKKFDHNQSSMPNQIESALLEEDRETAIRHLHTLKGTSATIGAMELYTLAAAEEKALMSDPSLMNVKSLDQIAQALNTVVNEIRSLAEESKEEKSVPFNREAFDALCLQLQAKLDNYDATADEIVEQLAPMADFRGREQLKKMRKALAKYDFDAAQALIQQLKVMSAEKMG